MNKVTPALLTANASRSVRLNFRRRSSLIAAGLLLLVTGGFTALAASLHTTQVAYADAKIALDRTTAELAEARKLTDTFENGWLDPTRWRTGRRKTTAQDGYARLNDRGSLVSIGEFPGPLEIELEWRWIDIAGDMAYRDTLTIALHTTGEHKETHPFRIRDGIEVAFQTAGGRVTLASPTDADFKEGTPESSLPMPAGKWHRIRIVDDGMTIAIYLSGPAIEKKENGMPVFQTPYTGTFSMHHIAIHNREPVAGALHESHIRNVTVGSPGSEKRE